jgi:hypothetical protein
MPEEKEGEFLSQDHCCIVRLPLQGKQNLLSGQPQRDLANVRKSQIKRSYRHLASSPQLRWQNNLRRHSTLFRRCGHAVAQISSIDAQGNSTGRDDFFALVG